MLMSVEYIFAVFQMLTITLDESDSFAAWVAAKDAGFTSPDGSDPKCKVVLVHSVKNTYAAKIPFLIGAKLWKLVSTMD